MDLHEWREYAAVGRKVSFQTEKMPTPKQGVIIEVGGLGVIVRHVDDYEYHVSWNGWIRYRCHDCGTELHDAIDKWRCKDCRGGKPAQGAAPETAPDTAAPELSEKPLTVIERTFHWCNRCRRHREEGPEAGLCKVCDGPLDLPGTAESAELPPLLSFNTVGDSMDLFIYLIQEVSAIRPISKVTAVLDGGQPRTIEVVFGE